MDKYYYYLITIAIYYNSDKTIIKANSAIIKKTTDFSVKHKTRKIQRLKSSI